MMEKQQYIGQRQRMNYNSHGLCEFSSYIAPSIFNDINNKCILGFITVVKRIDLKLDGV